MLDVPKMQTSFIIMSLLKFFLALEESAYFFILGCTTDHERVGGGGSNLRKMR